MSGHTPGPWDAKDFMVAANFNEGDPPIKVICYTANNSKTRTDENAANARLIAEAPAADLLLRMLMLGKAKIDPATGEIRFDGLRYSASDCRWSAVVAVMGWSKCERSLSGEWGF